MNSTKATERLATRDKRINDPYPAVKKARKPTVYVWIIMRSEEDESSDGDECSSEGWSDSVVAVVDNRIAAEAFLTKKNKTDTDTSYHWMKKTRVRSSIR